MELVSVFCMSGRDRTGKFYHCYLALQEVVGCWNWAESCQGARSTKHHLVSFGPFLKRVFCCLGIASIKVSLKFSKNGSCESSRLKFKWTWPGLAHCVGGKNCLSNKMFPEERFYGYLDWWKDFHSLLMDYGLLTIDYWVYLESRFHDQYLISPRPNPQFFIANSCGTLRPGSSPPPSPLCTIP